MPGKPLICLPITLERGVEYPHVPLSIKKYNQEPEPQ